MQETTTRFGGVVLCGGESRRMGAAKAWLPFGGQPLLARVVETLGAVVEPVVVVAANDSEPLPPLPEKVLVTRDRIAGRGPLEGLSAGLLAIEQHADAAFVCGCDAALLTAAVVRGLCSQLADHEAAVPVVSSRRQSLTSVLRTTARSEADAILAVGSGAIHALFDRLRCRFIDEDAFRMIDPELLSIRTMNTPAEYLAALAISGLPLPTDETLRTLLGIDA